MASNHLTKIYFVRHAETDYSNRDEANRPLTEKGLADREKVTAALICKNITKAYSSPYARAVDTIKPLCETLGLKIEMLDGFRERAVGEWLGGDGFSKFAERQWADFNYKLPGGESMLEVQERNIRALKSVLAECAGKSAVIGTHGMALSTIINYFNTSFGYADYEYIRPKMPFIVCFTFDGERFVKMEEISISNAVDAYIAKETPETRVILERVRAIIKECAPGAVEKISYGMPAYFLNSILLYFGACKNHLGIYPTADGMEAFRDKLTGYKISKGAVQFPYGKPIPYELIKEIVEYRVGKNAERG